MKKYPPILDFQPPAGMMSPRNTRLTPVWPRILVVAVLLLGPIMFLGVGLTAVQAQARGGEAIQAPLLDASHGKRAFRLVERWLSDSSSARRGGKPIQVTGLVGVRVVLRNAGVSVAEGRAYREDLLGVLDQPGSAVDLVPLLMLATERAEVGVLEKLADTRLRSVLAGRSVATNKTLSVADVSANLQLELELAYSLKTIALSKEAAPDAVFAHFAPAYHGLAFVDAGKGRWSWVWPGDIIARNIAPASQLVLGLKGLDIKRDAVDQLARPGGTGLARFSTIHVVRPYTGSDPTVLVRARSAQPRYAVSDRELVSISDRLIEHLTSRFTSNGEVRGTYHPTSGRYDPPLAVDDQAALACFAMVHYSRYVKRIKPQDQSAVAFAGRATRLAEEMANNLLFENQDPEPRVLALLLMTLIEAPDATTDKALRDRLGAKLLAYVNEQDKSGSRMNAGATALTAAALGAWYERTRDKAVGEVVWELMDQLWADPDRAPNLVALPWLALAHEWVGELLAEADDTGARRAELNRRRLLLAKMIDRLCVYQVIDKPKLGPDDVQGGFVLSPGPKGSPPSPDWRNAHPLMFISTVLRDDVATRGQDKLGWLLSAGYAARFVEQLMMNDASSFYLKDRFAARGAVRMAPWDNRLALAPTAMSLLAVTELQTTLANFEPAPTPAEQDDSAVDADTPDAE